MHIETKACGEPNAFYSPQTRRITIVVVDLCTLVDLHWDLRAAAARTGHYAILDTRPDVLPVPTICQMGKLRCLVVDTTDIVASSDLVDGVHPTQPACDRIAKRTLEMMKEQGVRR